MSDLMYYFPTDFLVSTYLEVPTILLQLVYALW